MQCNGSFEGAEKHISAKIFKANLHTSVRILQICMDLKDWVQRSLQNPAEKVLQMCTDSQRSKTWELLVISHVSVRKFFFRSEGLHFFIFNKNLKLVSGILVLYFFGAFVYFFTEGLQESTFTEGLFVIFTFWWERFFSLKARVF